MGAGDDHRDLAAAPAAARPAPRRRPVRRPPAAGVRAAERSGYRPTRRRWPRCGPGHAGVAVEQVGPARPGDAVADRPPAARPSCAAAPFDRALDTAWRRTSYSGADRGAHEPHGRRGGQRAGGARHDDETETTVAAAEPAGRPAPRAGPAVPSPMADLPGGRRLRHPGARGAGGRRPDRRRPAAELAARCAEQFAADRLAGVDPEALAAALLPVARTPLGRWPAAARWPTSRRPTGWPSWTSSCRWPAATGPTAGRPPLADVVAGCCAGTCRRRPAAPATPSAGRAGAGRPAAARLPHRQHRRGAAAARAPRLPRSSTTRPTGWARSAGRPSR